MTVSPFIIQQQMNNTDSLTGAVITLSFMVVLCLGLLAWELKDRRDKK